MPSWSESSRLRHLKTRRAEGLPRLCALGALSIARQPAKRRFEKRLRPRGRALQCVEIVRVWRDRLAVFHLEYEQRIRHYAVSCCLRAVVVDRSVGHLVSISYLRCSYGCSPQIRSRPGVMVVGVGYPTDAAFIKGVIRQVRIATSK